MITGCSAGTGSGRILPEGGPEAKLDTQRTSVADVKKESVEPSPAEREIIVAAGRSFEAEDLEGGVSELPSSWQFPSVLLLRARQAAKQGDYEAAVSLYHRLTDVEAAFEPLRMEELGKALAGAGRLKEAASQIDALLTMESFCCRSERIDLLELQASWLTKAGEHLGAVQHLQQALTLSDKGPTRDKLNLQFAKALVAGGDVEAGGAILRSLAVDAVRASVMRAAERELEAMGQPLRLSDQERLNRARKLAKQRAFRDAALNLEQLAASEKKEIAEEARWLQAKVLFDRRNSYKSAIAALEPIAAGNGPHAADAEFLVARSLSRIDRDQEAIRRYKRYAKKHRARRDADRARYLAARLEFYLGKHRAVQGTLESMVGRGLRKKRSKKVNLTQSEIRDAHFLAGMSALLLGRPAKATHHFEAASRGSNSENALARNRYWYAVSQMLVQVAKGANLLRDICLRDPTSWYARLSAERLRLADLEATECELSGIYASGELSGERKPLETLSPLASFLANAGLYREAARELHTAERDNPGKGTVQDWVFSYLFLEAPHYAIKRASSGLTWPPKAEDAWRVLAAYPSPHYKLVREVETKHELMQGLIYAIARKESLFDPHAVSRVGALGMMQMMPATYEHNRKKAGLPALKEGEIPEPRRSIRAAAFELEHLLKRFDGSYPLAIMAYNAGSKAVDRWLERSGGLPLDVFVEKSGFSQTRNYVKLVYRNLVRYRVLADAPAPDLPATAEIPKTAVIPGAKSAEKE